MCERVYADDIIPRTFQVIRLSSIMMMNDVMNIIRSINSRSSTDT